MVRRKYKEKHLDDNWERVRTHSMYVTPKVTNPDGSRGSSVRITSSPSGIRVSQTDDGRSRGRMCERNTCLPVPQTDRTGVVPRLTRSGESVRIRQQTGVLFLGSPVLWGVIQGSRPRISCKSQKDFETERRWREGLGVSPENSQSKVHETPQKETNPTYLTEYQKSRTTNFEHYQVFQKCPKGNVFR